MISNVITSAPGITVLRPIDNNYSVGGSTAAIGATVVYANKGPVGRPFKVNASNWQDILGRPLPMQAGRHAEGLRHLKDALDKCQWCEVVRAIGGDAKYPSVAFATDPETNAATNAHLFGSEVALGEGFWLAVWPIDGAPSTNRKVNITQLDTQRQRFLLQFTETVSGEDRAIPGESFEVGIDPEDVDDAGLSAYAPSVLEERSRSFRCKLALGAEFANVKEMSVAFAGGTNGTLPNNDEWKAGWDLLKSDDISFNLTFAAGCYEGDVLAKAITVAEGRLAPFKFDCPPWQTETKAKKWLTDLNLESYMAQAIHYPYKALDEWFGGKSAWGASGSLVSSKALCLSTPTGHAAVAGAHYVPAGEKRGRINRRGIEPIHTIEKLPPEELVKARITPTDKGQIINDCLNLWYKENYLRFEHVVAILVDIERDFIEAAAQCH